MAKQVVNGEDALQMIMGMVADIDDDDLAQVLGIVTGEPAKALGNDAFEVGSDD